MLPVDHHTAFHKTCGVATFALAALHTAMHLANIALNLAEDNYGAFAKENGMEVRAVNNSLSEHPQMTSESEMVLVNGGCMNLHTPKTAPNANDLKKCKHAKKLSNNFVDVKS